MPRKNVYKSGVIETPADDATRFPLFADQIQREDEPESGPEQQAATEGEEIRDVSQPAQQPEEARPLVEIGSKVNIVGFTGAEVVDARRIDGLDYELYRNPDGGGVIRVQDAETGKTATPIVTYSEFSTAQSRFETTIRLVEGEAEQIRENQPAGVESAGKEEKNDATATSIRSIRPSEVHSLEGGVSEPFGSGDHGESAQGVGGGDRDVRADGGGRGRPLGGEGADIARPEPGDDGIKTEAEERPEYVDAADPSRTKTQAPSAARKPDNYEITNLDALVPSGKKSKLNANFAAIGLLKELQAEGRAPTREEQHILAKFVGWGQFPALFNDINDAGEQLAEEREELKRVLGERDYERAKASTINAHYTAPKIVEKMWDVARRLGFTGGRVLEPGMGVGYFYGLMPRDLMAQSKLAGVEIDPTSGAIARMLYPNASINIKGFQEVRIGNGFYDLVITNVPFSENPPFDPEFRNLRAPLHDYYLIKSLDKVREGGLVIAITSSYTLDKAETRFRREMAKRSDLVAAFRFPDTVFKANAGTEVVTDLLIFRKRMAGEKTMGESASSDYLPAMSQLQGEEWNQSTSLWKSDTFMQRLEAESQPIVNMVIGSGIDRIQYHCEWKGKEQPPDSDIRLLRGSGLYQESQNVWVTPLVKHGQSSDWTKLGELPDPDGGDPIPINNYYVQHPDHILGILDRKSKLYRSNEPHVSGTSDFDERFERAISSLPENIFGESQTQTTEPEPETVADAILSNVVEGGYILRDGRILQRRGDSFVAVDFTPDEEAKAKRLISVRDALNALNAAQLKGEDTAEPRHALNKAYDHFVLWHGPIRKATNAKLLAKDPSSYLLLALETSYDTKRQKATKADIFFKDTIARAREAKDVSTPAAAVAVNLFETGRVDINRIAELLKTTPEEAGKRLVADGLAYENPGGAWETAEEYLSGNVRKKLIEAREAADVDDKFVLNVKALEKVQPADVPMDQISVKLGASWVPAQDIKNFAGHLMQCDPSGFRIQYAEGPATWTVSWGSTGVSHSSLATEVYGTAHANFVDVLDAALNDRPIKLYDTDADGNSYLDKEASDAANEKVKEVREKFADWLWTDDERAKRLHRYYNDNFNSLRVIEYTGAHYANEEGKYVLPGMNPAISLRPNQIKDVWQAVANGKLLDASEVGAGKTFILGAIAMEWKRLGLSRKPAIAVPKPRIAATVAELQLLYPAAKILSLEKSFDKENRKRTTAQMATGDYDMIVLSHEQLDKMPMSPDIVKEFIGAELEEIEDRIREAQETADEDGDSRAGNRIVKRLEKTKERVEAKLQEALDATNKDNVVYFEETGIDALLVDEAHAFKSLPVYSRRSEVKGVPSTRSDRATNMYMRTRWLMRQNNEKGVVFATGTPITNTLAEAYNWQRYLQEKLLRERGILNFDDWANQFAEVTTEFEYKASGTYEPVSRMADFVNLPELQQMIQQIMATNFVDDMPGVVRPKKVESVITAEMTQDQIDYLQTIRERVERLKRMSPRERKECGDNYLLISTDARKSALSPRLVNYRATDSGGKVEKVVEKVLEIHRARPDVAQMVFLDFGVNPNEWGYSVYQDIEDRLIAGRIPKERIANFGRMSDGARQKAAEKLNTGEYLIGLGSSGKMGTGINAQKRLAAMHHVDAPWLPALIVQRNGRGHRQGNMNDSAKSAEEQIVEANYFTTVGSFDVVMYQALTRKSNYIRQFMRGDMSVREMRFDDTGDEETGEMGPEMILAATSGNPYELDRVRLIKDIERLEKQARNYRQQQSRFRTQIAEGGRRRAEIEREIEEYEKDAAQYEATKGQKFSATFNGKTYDDRKVAGNQLAIAAVELPPRSHTKIGRYRGFDLYLDKGKERVDAYLKREDGEAHPFTLNLSEPEGAFNSADANLRHASSNKAQSEERLAALERDVETARAEVDKPFKRAEELEQKRQKLSEIQRKIEELYDQKPGRDVRKLASRLESLQWRFTAVGGVSYYDIANVRAVMADVVPNKAAFDRWLLALQNAGIVDLYKDYDIASRGNPDAAYILDPKTSGVYSDVAMKQGWAPKAANFPPITAFIESESAYRADIDCTPGSPAEISTQGRGRSEDEALVSLPNRGSIPGRSTIQTRSDIENSPEFEGNKSDLFSAAREENPQPIFYSQVERVISQKAPNKASGAQMLAIVTNPQSGVKKEELDWLGLREWLSDQQSVTKQEVLDFMRANQAQVQEIVKGGAETWRTYDWNRLEEGDFVRIPFDQEIKEILVIRNKEGDGESVSYSLVESDNRGNDWPVEDGDNLSLTGLRRKLEEINDEAPFDDGPIKDSIYNPIRPISRNETDDTNAALRAFERGEPVYFVSNRDGEAIRIWDERTFTSRESLPRDEVDAGRAVWRIGSPDAEGVTKYGAYTLPGGKQYRELLITMPDIRRERPPEPITELPEGYRVCVDPMAAPNARYRMLPPGQEHARPFYGVHPSREAAIAIAIEHINFQRQEEWERNRPSFRSPHWDEPNVLTHIRFNERVDADGKRTLFIEEIQSDWHQEGRKKGYKGRLPERWEIREEQQGRTAYIVVDHRGRAQSSSFDRQAAIDQAMTASVPDTTFKTSWPELAVKRALRWAVENGFDRVAWSTGETQAERYGLSTQIDRLKVLEGRYSNVRGTEGYEVTAWRNDREVISKRIPRDELPNLIGKEIAERAIAQIEANKQQPVPKYSAEFTGLDLKVGAAGMKGFYNQILPATVNKYIKEWGAKVAHSDIPAGGRVEHILGRQQLIGGRLEDIPNDRPFVALDANNRVSGDFATREEAEQALRVPVHSVEITSTMRESVLAGQPMFSRETQKTQAPAVSGYWGTPRVETKPVTRQEKLKVFEDAKSEFRERPDERGILWMNHQATIIIMAAAETAHVSIPTGGFSGVAMHISNLQKIVSLMQDRPPLGEAGESIAKLVENLEEAMADARGHKSNRVLMVDSTAGTLADVKSTVREERFHRWQDERGLMSSSVGTQLHRLFDQDPAYQLILRKLINRDGYDRNDSALLVTEAAAKIASGQWADYNLRSEEEGLELLHRYYRAAARIIGVDALMENAPATTQARGVQEDVREILTGVGAGTSRGRRRTVGLRSSEWLGDTRGTPEGERDPAGVGGRLQSGRRGGSQTPNAGEIRRTQPAARVNGQEVTPDELAVFKAMQSSKGTRFDTGAPAQITEARKPVGLSKEAFDQAALSLAEKGIIALHEHDYPTSLRQVGESTIKLDRRNPNILADVQRGVAPTSHSQNENTIRPLQGGSKSTGELIAALRTIANIEASDPSGRTSWKELDANVRLIASEAVTSMSGAASVWEEEAVAALEKIAGVKAVEREGGRISDRDRVEEAVKIARVTIAKTEPQAFARNIEIGAAEMTQTHEPSPRGQEIGW